MKKEAKDLKTARCKVTYRRDGVIFFHKGKDYKITQINGDVIILQCEPYNVYSNVGLFPDVFEEHFMSFNELRKEKIKELLSE